jgi:eukaryotic-like serine/threonine-protein kinase
MPHVLPLQADDPRPVGRYRLTGRLAGRDAAGGSTHRVFMARMVDGGMVIVTLLGNQRAAGPAARDRFTAEARVARRVAPFCAARILDAGIEGGDPYLVTEYVPGPTVAEAAGHDGPLPDLTVEALAIGTATGLTAIHQTGLVHGEFGPDRVVLGPDGPRVTHFGITPPYGAATPAADLLAWAQTVMFAAVGRPPVGPQDLAAVPRGIRPVVAACLSPDAAGRPAARAVLARLLRRPDSSNLLAEGARQARAAARAPETTPAPRHPEPAPRRSRPGVIGWAAACAVCVLAIAVGAVYITRQQPGARTAASPGTLPRPLPSASTPAALTGNWSGPVHQTSPVLTVSVRISLPVGVATGTIAYPSLGCSGRLAIVSAAGRRLTLDQIINRGRKNCANGVIMLAAGPPGSTGPPGTVRFTFLRSRGSNPAGTLTRSH